MNRTQANIDFKKDVCDEVGRILSELGFPVPSFQDLESVDRRPSSLKAQIKDYDLQNLLVHFFTVLRRVIPKQKRKVEFSKTFPRSRHQTEIERIKKKFENGDNINDHLSNRTKSLDQAKSTDLMLYEWNIYHLHLSPSRSEDLLLVYLTSDRALFLDVMQHENRSRGNVTWTNTDLVQIIHDNWPSRIQRYKYGAPENITVEQRRALRGKACNSPVTVADGTTYLPLGGGFMASKHPMDAIVKSDQLRQSIDWFQTVVTENLDDIQKALTIPSHEKPLLKLKLDDSYKPWVCEMNTKRKLDFAVQS